MENRERSEVIQKNWKRKESLRRCAELRSPKDIAEESCNLGVAKSQLKITKIFILAVLAGAYIGFGGYLAITITQDLSKHLGLGFSQFMGGIVFSVGLMLVVIGGAELFTGNNLIIVSCLSRKVKPKDLLKNWVIVYLGNFVGSTLLAVLIFLSGLYTMGGFTLGIRALTIANDKVNLDFVSALSRGILCNWLVCMAVWLTMASDDFTSKILSCIFPIMAFVASGFEHCIANMFFIPYGLLLKEVPDLTALSGLNLSNLTWSSFIFANLLPVTIGNVIGGAFFVGVLYYYLYLLD